MRLAALLLILGFQVSATGGVNWQPWTADLFKKSAKEKKLVILDLEAVWCHWCHVMEEKTYHHPEVMKILSEKFIAVKVDQDARPDISKRYEDWGWPATIFFDSNGKEISKHQGYIAPEEMVTLLKKIIENPEPTASVALPAAPNNHLLNDDLRADLLTKHFAQYDNTHKGFGFQNKYLFGDADELTLRRAWRGDKKDWKFAKDTLTAALNLIDPVWGGAYQYSVKTWKSPHYEKIARTQMKNLLLYSSAFALYGEEKFKGGADSVYKFLTTFLQAKNGAFYTSQDADVVRGEKSTAYFKLDDAGRRAKGIPVVDKHQYARENGWFIASICAYYAATGNEEALAKAKKAAQWVLNNRAIKGGGFRHDKKDAAGPYLGDTLEMGRAFLALYQTTADRKWLKHASNAAEFIAANFSHSVGETLAGFKTAKTGAADTLPAEPVKDENIRLARWANLLHRYTGKKAHRDLSEQAMVFLATPSIASEVPTAGVLLADIELGEDPVHLTVVGAKADPKAADLFQSALRYPSTYKRVEWWDAKEGKLPNANVEFPKVEVATLFACNKGVCSQPIASVDDLAKKLDKLFR